MVQDEFNPIALGEEMSWEDGGYTNVDHVIKKLDDKITHLMKNPRLFILFPVSRLSVICYRYR